MKYLKSKEIYLKESNSELTDCPVTNIQNQFDLKIDNKYKDIDLSEFNNIIEILKRDCSKFIKELNKDYKNILFRGSKSFGKEIRDGMWINSSRKRNPRDTKKVVSDKFDEKFDEKFGIKLRSDGVFTTKDPIGAAGYSIENDPDVAGYLTSKPNPKAYIFFPIGDYYRYFWNPQIDDLFSIETEPWYRFYELDGEQIRDYYRADYINQYKTPFDGISHNNGYFEFLNIKIPSNIKEMVEMKKYIINNHEEFGLKPNGSDGYIDSNGKLILHKTSNLSLSFDDDLKWIPNISFEEYFQKNKPKDSNVEIDYITNGYREGGLEKVKCQEVTFKCEKYYLIDEKYYSELKKYLD